jgi:DNA (cytosine-5)-methyltransferase 1
MTKNITVSDTVAKAVNEASRPVSFSGKREPLFRLFASNPGLKVVDHFAGGGGASSGVSAALAKLGLNREPDVAINHDPEAIAMHKVNHPNTKHYIEDIWKVDPHEVLKAIGGERIGLLWASPTCQHFSKAKGTALDETSVKMRGLCWEITSWAARVEIDVICAENVEEFQKFGPLHKTHNHGCSKEYANKKVRRREGQAQAGKLKPRGCKANCHYCKPIKEKEGTLYRAFIRRLEKLGYVVETRVLRACDYGAPTTRKRWFMVARKDGRPIVWPAPTHGPEGSGLLPFRTAAECIDWKIPCKSIFGRAKPLADKTLARIQRGVEKFVLNASKPFIVPTSYGDKGGSDVRVMSVDEPLRTVCGNRSSFNVVDIGVQPAGCDWQYDSMAVPYMVHRSNGERGEVVKPDGTVVPGQAPRVYDIQQPHPTVMAQGVKTALSMAYLVKNNGGNNDRNGNMSGQDFRRPMDTVACRDQKSLAVANLVRYNGERTATEVRGQDIGEPVSTIDTSNRFGLIASHLTKLRGTSDAHIGASAKSLEEPMDAISAQGNHYGQVAAYLVRYNGKSEAQSIDKPAGTLTTKDRYGLVSITLSKDVCEAATRVAKFLGYDKPLVIVIGGEQWVLVDIAMRMLVARELFNANSFSPDYKIDFDADGNKFTETAKIRMCGNAVPPKIAEALATAQLEAA